MSATTTASAEGSVYELVARGNKDTFFFGDRPESKFLFDNTYEVQAPSSFEVRRVPPRTAAEFGRTVEFDLDLVGDLMHDPTIIIQLPTWLPSLQAQANPFSLTQDANNTSYGYVNGIAYFLFERIQFFQDNILLQEFSGDSLWATSRAEGSYAHTFVTTQLTGEHDGSQLSISRNATPNQLRLSLPLIGTQTGDPGFPQRAVTNHSYRLRCKLRKLEDLVESSDLTSTAKPTPWGKTLFQTTQTGTTEFVCLSREEIQPPNLLLETRQIYVSRPIQDGLQTRPQKVPFRRLFENTFSQNNADYISVLGGGSSFVSRRLDGRHPTERILWFFRSLDDMNANRLWKVGAGSTDSSYYSSVSLLVAGQSRELPRTPLVWRDITNWAKEDIDTGIQLNSMNWGLGALVPERFPESRSQPTGTINMTTADRPTFYIDLANPQTTFPATQLYVITESWAELETDGKGRGFLFSQN